MGLLAGGKAWRRIGFKVRGEFDNRPLQMSGKFGPPAALLAAHNLDIDVAFSHGELKGRIDGRLARFDRLHGSRFAVSASAPSLSSLRPWIGVDMGGNKPLKFTRPNAGRRAPSRTQADRRHDRGQ